MSVPLLAGERLRMAYGPRTVVDVDRIEAFEGETLAVLGPNGAGKSTLLRLLAMLEKPTAGRVTFRGHGGSRAERGLRASCAFVLQRPHLWRDSVAYNVGLGLRLRGVSRLETDRRVERVCEALGIGAVLSSSVTSLSRGHARRVALAQALVLEPDLLLLDEPLADLDPDARASVREDLARIRREHPLTIVMATHDRNEAFHLADRVAVLRDGGVARSGSPVDLYLDPVRPYASEPTGAELVLPGRVHAADGHTLSVDVGGLRLSAVGRASPGDRVRVSYRPEDLVLGRAVPTAGGLSARNLFYATVSERRDDGGLVRVRLRGPFELVALLTRSGADSLELAPDARVTVRVKATALRVHGPPAGPRPPGEEPTESDEPGADRRRSAVDEREPSEDAAEAPEHAAGTPGDEPASTGEELDPAADDPGGGAEVAGDVEPAPSRGGAGTRPDTAGSTAR